MSTYYVHDSGFIPSALTCSRQAGSILHSRKLRPRQGKGLFLDVKSGFKLRQSRCFEPSHWLLWSFGPQTWGEGLWRRWTGPSEKACACR